MVTMFMGNSDKKFAAANKVMDYGMKGLSGSSVPFYIIGQVDEQCFFSSPYDVHIRTVVHADYLTVINGNHTCRIAVVSILYIIDIIGKNFYGIGAFIYWLS